MVKTALLTGSVICTLHTNNQSNPIKDDKMVGQEEKMGDTITRLKHKIFAGIVWEGVDWIHLAQERIMAGSTKHDNGHSTIDGTFD
jgi:hypothetical protein